MSTPTPQKRRVLMYALLSISLLACFFAYSKINDYNTLEEVLIKDKQDLQIELEGIVKDYKKLNVKNKKLSRRVIKEINKIISLKDSVNTLETKNFDLIRSFRKRTAKLQKENRLLIAKVDSLNFVNDNLKRENILARESLSEKNIIAQNLENKNNRLSRVNRKLKKEIKIAPSRELKTSVIRAFAMRERSGGSLDITDRYNKVDAFRINFKLLKNNYKKAGETKIHIQIIDANGKVTSEKPNKFKLKNGKSLIYSDELIADYKNKEVDVLSLVLVDRDKMTHGEYKINVFIDGSYSTSSLVFL